MIETLRKILKILTQQERTQALWLLLLTIVMAFFEIVGIASILPFMAVLASPEIIHGNKWLAFIYAHLGFENHRHFMIFLGGIVLSLLIVGNSLKAFTRWSTFNFSMMSGHQIGIRLLTQYLCQPYAFFLVRNSATLRKSVIGEVQSIVTNFIIPLMDLVARSLVVAAIALLILFVDPILALMSIAILGGSYAIVYFSIRHWLYRLGKERLASLSNKTRIISDAFLGIKNLKISGLEKTYVELFTAPSLVNARAGALSGIAAEIPRYALEIIAFGGILFIVLYELVQNSDIRQALPMISLYALAGYRLLPNIQAGFGSLAKMRFNGAVLDHVYEELTQTTLSPSQQEAMSESPPPALPFHSTISLENLSFAYEGVQERLFETISLSIAKNERIGIVGKTGSGKTTLVDILLGILLPSSGTIRIDGTPLTHTNIRAWQRNIAYVPQHIFLTDDTIRHNIAFGIPEREIDEERVKKALKMAALEEFVSSLPNGYETVVGENGVRLSGGQRQRIGLARALYLDRPVLVLDEATSALDTNTEDEIIDAVRTLGGDKTILIIAHRTRTLEGVDRIINLDSLKGNTAPQEPDV